MSSVRAAAIAIASFVVLSQAALVQLTPTDVVTNDNVLIAQYQTINTALLGIETSSSAASVISTGQEVVSQFNTVITNLNADVTAMQATAPPFTDSQAAPIVSSLANYVVIHQSVMATLISKHPIFAQFGLTAPITAVLKTLEASIDSYSFAMLNLIPTRNADVAQDKNALDTSTERAINTYDQVCVPSPLYPIVIPVCATPQ